MPIHRVLIRDNLRQFCQAIKPAPHVRWLRLPARYVWLSSDPEPPMRAGRSRDTLQRTNQFDQQLAVETTPCQQATLAAQANLDRPGRPRPQRHYLDECRLGQPVWLGRRSQPPFPGVEGTLGNSPFQAVGRYCEPAGPLAINDLTPFPWAWSR